jgi:hypothetical protein
MIAVAQKPEHPDFKQAQNRPVNFGHKKAD